MRVNPHSYAIDFLFRDTRFYNFADISKIGQNITRGIFAG